MSGKFICIEGADGSGKGTQADLLVKRLFNEGYKVKFFDFPQYEKTFFGEMSGKMLAGEYGPVENIDPNLASLPYAFDRWQASPEIKKTVNEGNIAIANRFTLSSMTHQAARMPKEKRPDFIKFIRDLENITLKIPTPNLYIYLRVPVELSRELILKKEKRKYLKDGKLDQLEDNLEHQFEASRIYDELSNQFPNIVKINCCDENGKLKNIDKIHNAVWKETTRVINYSPEGQKKGKER